MVLQMAGFPSLEGRILVCISTFFSLAGVDEHLAFPRSLELHLLQEFVLIKSVGNYLRLFCELTFVTYQEIPQQSTIIVFHQYG